MRKWDEENVKPVRIKTRFDRENVADLRKLMGSINVPIVVNKIGRRGSKSVNPAAINALRVEERKMLRASA